MKGEALKGHLDLLLLAAVRSRPSHGYAIIEELKRKSRGALDLADGTVYPALHRLESEGLLKSKWERPQGRRCRVYSLTDKGRTALGEQHNDWKRFAAAMSAVLESR